VTPKNFKQVGGAESEADAGDIFLDQFLGVDADDFAPGIQQRAAAVAGVDGSVGLNPGAGSGGFEAADSTDDSLGNAEEHGIAGISDGHYAFTLAHRGGFSENQTREAVARGLCERDIQIGIDVNNFGFQLRAVRERCQ